MLKINCNINQQNFENFVNFVILSSLNNFQSLEVVDRVSETQLQVGEKYNLAVNGLSRRKINDWGFGPILCTYQLILARKNSWGWWDDSDDLHCYSATRFETPTSRLKIVNRQAASRESINPLLLLCPLNPKETVFYPKCGLKYCCGFGENSLKCYPSDTFLEISQQTRNVVAPVAETGFSHRFTAYTIVGHFFEL